MFIFDECTRTYSSGDCSGFTPDSLLRFCFGKKQNHYKMSAKVCIKWVTLCRKAGALTLKVDESRA